MAVLGPSRLLPFDSNIALRVFVISGVISVRASATILASFRILGCNRYTKGRHIVGHLIMICAPSTSRTDHSFMIRRASGLLQRGSPKKTRDDTLVVKSISRPTIIVGCHSVAGGNSKEIAKSFSLLTGAVILVNCDVSWRLIISLSILCVVKAPWDANAGQLTKKSSSLGMSRDKRRSLCISARYLGGSIIFDP